MENPETDILSEPQPLEFTIRLRDGLGPALMKLAAAWGISMDELAEKAARVAKTHQKFAMACQELRATGMAARGMILVVDPDVAMEVTATGEFNKRAKDVLADLAIESMKLAEAYKYEMLQRDPVDWRALSHCTGFQGQGKKPYKRHMFHMKHFCRADRRGNKRKTFLKQLCKRNA